MIIDLTGRAGGPKLGEIRHKTSVAPVGTQALRTFKDNIWGLPLCDSVFHKAVAGVVIQIFHRNPNVGILLVKIGQQTCNHGRIGPVADRIGPQRDFSKVWFLFGMAGRGSSVPAFCLAVRGTCARNGLAGCKAETENEKHSQGKK